LVGDGRFGLSLPPEGGVEAVGRSEEVEREEGGSGDRSAVLGQVEERRDNGGVIVGSERRGVELCEVLDGVIANHEGAGGVVRKGEEGPGEEVWVRKGALEKEAEGVEKLGMPTGRSVGGGRGEKFGEDCFIFDLGEIVGEFVDEREAFGRGGRAGEGEGLRQGGAEGGGDFLLGGLREGDGLEGGGSGRRGRGGIFGGRDEVIDGEDGTDEGHNEAGLGADEAVELPRVG